MRVIFLIVLSVVTAYAETADSLMLPDASDYDADYWEGWELVSKTNKYRLRYKAVHEGPMDQLFVFNRVSASLYFHQTIYDSQPTETYWGISGRYKRMQFSSGRGYVKIGSGMILGNEFGRFGADPATNLNTVNVKMQLSPYSYQNYINAFEINGRSWHLLTFERSGNIGLAAQKNSAGIDAGLAVLSSASLFCQTWLMYHGLNSRWTADVSLQDGHYNHSLFELKYKMNSPATWVFMVLNTADTFGDIAGDTKWGSSALEGTTGINGGIMWHAWHNIRFSFFSVAKTGANGTSAELYSALQWHKDRFALQLRLNHIVSNETGETSEFPYGSAEQLIHSDKVQYLLAYRLNTELKISGSGSFYLNNAPDQLLFIRLEKQFYQQSFTIQYSYGQAPENALYFLRPYYPSAYLIQQVTKNASWFDILYVYHYERITFSVGAAYQDQQISTRGQMQIDFSQG